MLGPECRAKSLKTIMSCHSGLILVLEESESHSYVCSCVETDEGLVANLGCHGDTSRKKEPWNCLLYTGLWAYLRGIFLIVNCYRHAQPTVGGTLPRLEGLRFRFLHLDSCLEFWPWFLSPLFHWIALGQDFYQSNPDRSWDKGWVPFKSKLMLSDWLYFLEAWGEGNQMTYCRAFDSECILTPRGKSPGLFGKK